MAIIVLAGVPHGALDNEIARSALRPCWGRAWFVVFSLPYLTLSAVVLLAWRAAPLATLAGFLALSVLHFGMEDVPGGQWRERLVRGGLPIGLPVLLQPGATAHLLGTVAGVPLDALPGWLVLASLLWLTTGLLWLLHDRPATHRLTTPCFLLAAYTVLPPLAAFALYFVCVHAPAHTVAIIADTVRAPRVRDWAEADRRALPLTALTLLLGAGLWFSYVGPVQDRLLALTIQGLAALTLPHMLLDWWTVRRLRT